MTLEPGPIYTPCASRKSDQASSGVPEPGFRGEHQLHDPDLPDPQRGGRRPLVRGGSAPAAQRAPGAVNRQQDPGDPQPLAGRLGLLPV